MSRLCRSLPLLLLVASASGQAADVPQGFVLRHATEPLLLNKQIEPAALRALHVWDARTEAWRPPRAGEAPGERSTLVVLHLWATYCAPCREEFPLWRQLAEDLRASKGDRVRIVFLSETQSNEEMHLFFSQNRERMPSGPHYLDAAESIAEALRRDQSMPLAYPLTVILDERRVVRHALVGKLKGRRAELLTAIERLLSLPQAAQPAK